MNTAQRRPAPAQPALPISVGIHPPGNPRSCPRGAGHPGLAPGRGGRAEAPPIETSARLRGPAPRAADSRFQSEQRRVAGKARGSAGGRTRSLPQRLRRPAVRGHPAVGAEGTCGGSARAPGPLPARRPPASPPPAAAERGRQRAGSRHGARGEGVAPWAHLRPHRPPLPQHRRPAPTLAAGRGETRGGLAAATVLPLRLLTVCESSRLRVCRRCKRLHLGAVRDAYLTLCRTPPRLRPHGLLRLWPTGGRE